MICPDCHKNKEPKPDITPRGHKVLVLDCECGFKRVVMAVKHD